MKRMQRILGVIVCFSFTARADYMSLQDKIKKRRFKRIQKLEQLKPDPSIEVEFVIVIPSYNNEHFCEGNLASVVNQFSSRPYEVIYLNDCSTDATGKLVDRYVAEHNVESRVRVIHNKKRIGAYGNLYHAVHTYIPDHKVVVIVDGDDQLISNYVLLRLEQEYKNPDIWLTYGHYIRNTTGKDGHARKVSREVLEQRNLRKMHKFCVHHLKTFKAGLFKKIDRKDLLYKGRFWPTSGDMAIMYPMVEMCSPRLPGGVIHCKFIDDPLYIYNMENPISDFRAQYKKQGKTTRAIKRMTPYEPIESID